MSRPGAPLSHSVHHNSAQQGSRYDALHWTISISTGSTAFSTSSTPQSMIRTAYHVVSVAWFCRSRYSRPRAQVGMHPPQSGTTYFTLALLLCRETALRLKLHQALEVLGGWQCRQRNREYQDMVLKCNCLQAEIEQLTRQVSV